MFTSVSPSFSLSISTRVTLSSPSSCPSFCLSNQLLLTTEAFSFSALYLPRQPSKCYPHSLACFVSTSFHFSSGATFFLPVIIQPQLNCKSGWLFHNIALSLTLSLLCPPSLSSSVSQWTFSGVFMTQKLKLNWRRVIKAKMESDLIYPPHPSFLLSLPCSSSLPPSCITQTVSSFRCLFALQPERAPWFACCHSITKPNSECVLSARQNVL